MAVQKDPEGAEVNWIIETKSQVWEGPEEKDAAIRVCELRASGRYGRYIRLTPTGRPVINRAKVKAAERLDGKFVVHSNDDTRVRPERRLPRRVSL